MSTKHVIHEVLAGGLPGPPGPPGPGLRIAGRADTEAGLPAPAEAQGVGWLVGDDLYVAVGGAWRNLGPVRGPQGPPGKSTALVATTAPQDAEIGDVWWNPAAEPGTGPGGGATVVVSPTEPASPGTGLIWLDTGEN